MGGPGCSFLDINAKHRSPIESRNLIPVDNITWLRKGDYARDCRDCMGLLSRDNLLDLPRGRSKPSTTKIRACSGHWWPAGGPAMKH